MRWGRSDLGDHDDDRQGFELRSEDDVDDQPGDHDESTCNDQSADDDRRAGTAPSGAFCSDSGTQTPAGSRGLLRELCGSESGGRGTDPAWAARLPCRP